LEWFSGSKIRKNNWLPSKAVKRIFAGVMIFILLLVGLLLSLRFRAVQTWVVNRYLSGIDEKYNGHLSVGNVLVRWPRRIEVDDFLVLDMLNDTLFYSPKIRLAVKHLNLDRNHLSLGRLDIEQPVVELRQLPSGRWNYQILMDALGSVDTTSVSRPLTITAGQFLIHGGTIQYRKFGSVYREGRVNPDDLLFRNVEASIRNIDYGGSSVKAGIELLAFQEQSGFVVNEFKADVTVDSLGVSTRNLDLITAQSRVESPEARLRDLWGTSGRPGGPDMEIILGSQTSLSPIDLKILTGIETGQTRSFEISGVFTGTLRNARLSDAVLNWPDLIYFNGDLAYRYPGELKETYFDLKTRALTLEVHNLVTELLSGQIPGLKLDVPSPVANLGSVKYDGSFNGTFENFVTTGNWAFAFGDFMTNLKVVKNKPEPGYNFLGSVAAAGIDPDQWITETSWLSDVVFNLKVDGVWDGDKSVTALLDGKVDQFRINGYTYHNLNVNGRATGNRFNGTLALKDPNLDMLLDGDFDFGKEKPVLDFNMKISHADLHALDIVRTDKKALLQAELHGNFKGTSIDELDGEINVRNSSYTNSRGTLPVTELTLSSEPELGHRKIMLSSEYLDARLVGSIHAEDLLSQVQSLAARFMPALTKTLPVRTDHLNDFAFNIQIKNGLPVEEVLLPGFLTKDNTRIGGFYHAADQTISIEGISPQFAIAGTQYTGLDIRIESRGDSLVFDGGLEKVQLDRNTVFERITMSAYLSGNRLSSKLSWNRNGVSGSWGEIGCSGIFSQSGDGSLTGVLRFPESEMMFNDSLWKIDPFMMVANRNRFSIDHFRLTHADESLALSGGVSLDPADTLHIRFNRVNLANLSRVTGSAGFELDGHITGQARFFDLRTKPKFLTEARIDSLTVNGESMGPTTISSRSQGPGEPLSMDVLVRRGNIKTIEVHGRYNPLDDSLDFDVVTEKLKLDLVNPFVNNDLRDVKGLATGKINIRGTPKKPLMYGNIMVQKASFIVDCLNARYYFSNNVVVTPDAFSVTNLDLLDDEGNHATVNGAVRHANFQKIALDLKVDFKDFVLLNEEESRNMGYWGRGHATGVGTIKGSLLNLQIDVSARTRPGTKFFIPVYTTTQASAVDFVTYVEKPRGEEERDLLDFTEKKKVGYEVNLYGATVNIDLEATPDADVQLIFDSKVGDVIRAKGSGNLRVYIPPTSMWTLTGDYTIDEGDYQFTVQEMPVKRFQIEQGGTLKWTGDVYNAQLDIDAVYRTKASLYDLLQDESTTDLTQRLPVECHLLMTGYLESPVVDFNIVIPQTSNDIARSQVQSLNKEEMSRQVISLLFLNRFSPLQGTTSGTARGYESAGLATTTEVLSNQLNYWLSQISKDFDVGFNYRPGDQLTSDEVEVALSKQFLNNRITVNVNGNYDVRSTSTNTNQLVGDVDVEYKIKPSGKVRLKAFTRANDHLLYEYAPYTQGVGIFYREEFNTFGDLLRKYRDKLFRKKR
jgi:hypothetical protein